MGTGTARSAGTLGSLVKIRTSNRHGNPGSILCIHVCCRGATIWALILGTAAGEGDEGVVIPVLAPVVAVGTAVGVVVGVVTVTTFVGVREASSPVAGRMREGRGAVAGEDNLDPPPPVTTTGVVVVVVVVTTGVAITKNDCPTTTLLLLASEKVDASGNVGSPGTTPPPEKDWERDDGPPPGSVLWREAIRMRSLDDDNDGWVVL